MPYADREQQKAFEREYMRAYMADKRLKAKQAKLNGSNNRSTNGSNIEPVRTIPTGALPYHQTPEQVRQTKHRPEPTYSGLRQLLSEQDEITLLKARVSELESALGVIQRIAAEHAPLPYSGSYSDGEPADIASEL